MALDSDRARTRGTAARWQLAAIAVVAVLGALLGNGSDRPLEEHEVFVARTAVEMQRNGDWLVPHFNGELRLEKPPLAYWTAIAAHKLVGSHDTLQVGEFAARLPAALSGIALIAVTWALALATFRDRRAAFAAAAMWATGSAFYGYTHNARPEMLYALFTAGAVLGFVRLAQGDGRATGNALFAWSNVALAMLAKGPFLPLFALIGVVLANWVQRRRERASLSLAANLRPWLGVALVLGTSGAYFAYVALNVPGALDFWREQMFHRTAGGSDRGSWTELLTFPYLFSTPAMLAPWLFFIPFGVLLVWRTHSLAVRYQGFAFVVALACLSCSRNGHGYYTLPVLPLACSLMGGAAVELVDRWRASEAGARRLAVALGLHIALALLAAIAVAAAVFSRYSQPTPAGRIACILFAAFALLAAIAAWRARREFEVSFTTLALSLALSIAAVAAGNVGWERDRFTKADFAKQVARVVPATLPIASTDEGRELVIYYADRNVAEVTYRELGAFLASNPGALVMSRRVKLAERQLSAREVVAEDAPPGRDPLVLVEVSLPSR
jgi:4-amino-4-deoxy-L-arabinose transferase-like glycosyltransferase